MPVQPAQYQWRPDDHYQQWNVCDDCLFPLADALQYRVETWHRPPRDEEDDSRPDYGEILQRRFHEAFDRPLDQDLQRFDFARALIWLQLHAPLSAAEAQRRLDALRDALDPDKYGRDPDLLIVPLADTAWYFRQLAQEISATQPPKDQGEQPKGDQDRTGSLPVQSGSAKLSPRELASKHGVAQRALQARLERWRYEHDAGYVEVSNPVRNKPKYLYDESAVMPVIEALKAKSVAQKRATDV
jgi:hypothetical protein